MKPVSLFSISSPVASPIRTGAVAATGDGYGAVESMGRRRASRSTGVASRSLLTLATADSLFNRLPRIVWPSPF